MIVPAPSSPSHPSRGTRLLRTEAAALLPLLRATPASAFTTPTVLPGWSVRDVLAHCSAALGMAASGQFHAFTPSDNQQDVDLRRGWPLDDLLAELESGYEGGAKAVEAAEGRLDGLALGEWVHGGDVRDALRLPDAWASEGVDDALVLLTERSIARGLPRTLATLGSLDRVEIPREVVLGTLGTSEDGTRPPARLRTDTATLIRLCAGRRPDLSRIELTGATPAEFVLFS